MKKHQIQLLVMSLVLTISFSSCQYFFPNLMLRETKDFYYYELKELDDKQHIVLPGDFISFVFSPMKGTELLDNTLQVGSGMNQMMMMSAQGGGMGGPQYFVRDDGKVNLPIVGEIYVSGMKRLDLEKQLAEKLSSLFVDPFLAVNISNRRAFVFAGIGKGQVVPLPRENTSLIELLALAGGLAENAKANKIRIIRGDYENPTIKKIDMSTIKGLKDADIIIQSNDLVIIDPTTRAVPALLREMAPYLSLFTTIFTLIVLLRTNKQ